MTELTPQEQVNVRTALRFLRTRCGGWSGVAKALQLNESTLSSAVYSTPPSARIVLRVARLADVPVDDVLNGRYPGAGTCPHCGHRPESSAADAAAR